MDFFFIGEVSVCAWGTVIEGEGAAMLDNTKKKSIEMLTASSLGVFFVCINTFGRSSPNLLLIDC